MTDYLSYSFEDSAAFIDTFDELPLWSAAFGLFLLRHLELQGGLTIVDIGSGTGFPLLELAARCGNSCTLYGIDPWKNANRRAREKIRNYGLQQVSIFEQSANHLPFSDNSVDLIVSNLGLNNFEDPGQVFGECRRVLKPGGRLALSTNLFGHWKELYAIFYDTLYGLGRPDLADKLEEEEKHRSTMESLQRLFQDHHFQVSRIEEDQLEMQFVDGTAFLNHHFVQLGWLDSWRKLFPAEVLTTIFSTVESKLNDDAKAKGSLKLSVPMLFIEGRKN